MCIPFVCGQWRIQDFLDGGVGMHGRGCTWQGACVAGGHAWKGANLLFAKIFAENCMKLKEIGPNTPLDPSMVEMQWLK